MEAARCSDVNLIGSFFGRDLFMAAAGGDRRLADSFEVIPPPALVAKPTAKRDGRTVIYNHRLYQHYGTEAMFEVLDRVNSVKLLAAIRGCGSLLALVIDRGAAGQALHGKQLQHQLQRRGFIVGQIDDILLWHRR